MHQTLLISQIAVSGLLIAAILLQQRGTGGSSIFGGIGGGESYYTKRGFEKVIFIATIILSGLFIVSAFLNLLI